ncbi:MAG: protein-L-isoaspartate O-methyltransferase, partial [Deltaproteobacteria bacterium]|nr:protein-L-isoaspartate O-methyltransferase [Deltaproteobacteria bacterium]
YSVERISRLADRTRKLLDSLNYYNILIKVGDGTQGWSDEAPFDAIVVTAGAPFVPPLLFGQLKDGGRLVVPVGDDYIQDLMRYTKRGGEIIAENLGGCRFVKLIGKDGFED